VIEHNPLALEGEKLELARKMYLFLASLFIAALVTCNIIANKFVTVDIWMLGYWKTFTISVGILPYPLTFLITDLLSEVYGRKRTNHVVMAGFGVSVFVLFVLWLGHVFPAIPNSPVSDEAYDIVFQNSWRVMSASMVAYLAAQFLDVRLFHFWKGVTKGKKLWVRNNFSTITSQFVDTFLVVSIIFIGRESWDTISGYILDGWLFKVIIALFDTFLIYIAMWGIKRHFNLQPGQEVLI
jgi:uncharacterized integral membrane protein (TIGR00697 family)